MNKENTKKYDYRFWGEITLFVILLYGISSYVYLNGDDFMYAAFAKTGIFQNITNYYFTGNGRYWINILDSVLLWFDRVAFILILPWIVLAFVVLLAKVIQRLMAGRSDWGKEKDLIRMGMVLFACLDILCLRETVFWITGMMNYLFPAVVFLFGYLMFLKSRAGELKGMGLALYLMVCLLAASSVEQFALMFVGMMTLHHGYDVIKKVRIPLYEWGVFGLSLIGLATLILAPGNFSRVDEQGLLMPPFIDNAWTLFYQNTGSPVAIPYIFMLAVIVMMSCMGTKKGMLSRTMAVNGVCVVGCVIAPLLDNAIFIVVMMLLLGWQIIVLLVREKAHFGPQIYFLIFVGIGSQVMLLISAVWGFRCMLSMYMVYMLLIGCLLYHMDVDHRRYVLIAGLLMSIHPVLALVFCSVLMVRKQAWRAFLDKALPVALRCVVVLVMVGLLMGYAKNAPIHRQNLRRTAEIQGDMIVIEELPNDIYSWYFVPISEFHEEYYRLLHEIPENVEIVYEKLHE